MNLKSELYKINEKKRKYFHWRNKLDTRYNVYSEMNDEDFKEFAKIGDSYLTALQLWEKTEEYSKFLYMLAEDRFNLDLYEVYIALKEEALKGNTSATKEMINVQREMTKRIKQFNKVDEDDGLNVNI